MLKDRDKTKPRRLSRLGIIRLGHKETKVKTGAGGKSYEVSYPVQDEHFVLTDAPEIAEHYGPTPVELDIMLPFPDIERNFDASYTVWAGGVLVCKGDGEFVSDAVPFKVETKDNGKVSVYNAPGDTLVNQGVAQRAFTWGREKFEPGDTVPCPGAAKGMYPHCAACKLSAILKMLMAKPELFRLGYYQLATGSGSNYDSIMFTLELIRGDTDDPITGEKRRGSRPVSGIPYKLRMVKRAFTFTDENGKRQKTEKMFLQLEPDPTFTRAAFTATARAAFEMVRRELPMLEAPADEFDAYEAEEAAPPPYALDATASDDDEPGDLEAGGMTDEPASTDAATAIKRKLAAAADGKDIPETNEKRRGLFCAKLESCFSGNSEEKADARKLVTWFLFDAEDGSSKALTEGQTRAWLAEYVAPGVEGDKYPLAPHAVTDMAAVYHAALLEAGQQELPMDDDDTRFVTPEP